MLFVSRDLRSCGAWVPRIFPYLALRFPEHGAPSALAKPSWLLTLVKGHWGLRVTCQHHRESFGGLFYYLRPTGSPVIRLAWNSLCN